MPVDSGLWFGVPGRRKVPEPKTAKNRVHIDLASPADRETEVTRLIGLGAKRVADKAEWGHRWTVMADPEGNEFCIASSATGHPTTPPVLAWAETASIVFSHAGWRAQPWRARCSKSDTPSSAAQWSR